MPSSGMVRRVAPVGTEVSEERRFLQEPHVVTSQKTAFFFCNELKTFRRGTEISWLCEWLLPSITVGSPLQSGARVAFKTKGKSKFVKMRVFTVVLY
jgi:hypothetical protein